MELPREAPLVLLAGDRKNVDVVLGHSCHILLALRQFLLQQSPQPRALVLVNLHLKTQLRLRGHLQRLFYTVQLVSYLLVAGPGLAQLAFQSLIARLLQQLGFDPLFALVQLLKLSLPGFKVGVECLDQRFQLRVVSLEFYVFLLTLVEVDFKLVQLVLEVLHALGPETNNCRRALRRRTPQNLLGKQELRRVLVQDILIQSLFEPRVRFDRRQCAGDWPGRVVVGGANLLGVEGRGGRLLWVVQGCDDGAAPVFVGGIVVGRLDRVEGREVGAGLGLERVGAGLGKQAVRGGRKLRIHILVIN